MKRKYHNYFLQEKIKVKENPIVNKIYNTFSRPCRDDMPHPKTRLFSK